MCDGAPYHSGATSYCNKSGLVMAGWELLGGVTTALCRPPGRGFGGESWSRAVSSRLLFIDLQGEDSTQGIKGHFSLPAT